MTCPYGKTSCIACLQWDKKQFNYCYPYLNKYPHHPDRFKHRTEITIVQPKTISSENRGKDK